MRLPGSRPAKWRSGPDRTCRTDPLYNCVEGRMCDAKPARRRAPWTVKRPRRGPHLEGQQIGPAKDFRQELSAGTHVIQISAKGCEPTKQRVTIVAGDTLRVPLQLVRWIRKTRQWIDVEPCR